MVEGTISEWKIAEGAFVNKGDTLMEFENEKNVIPCDALDSGILHIIAQADETVEVGKIIDELICRKPSALSRGKAREFAAPWAGRAIPSHIGNRQSGETTSASI